MTNVSPSVVGETTLAVGTGYYDNEGALGMTVAHAPRAGMVVSAGMAVANGGKPVVRAAVAMRF